jgi:hypothetical protein
MPVGAAGDPNRLRICGRYRELGDRSGLAVVTLNTLARSPVIQMLLSGPVVKPRNPPWFDNANDVTTPAWRKKYAAAARETARSKAAHTAERTWISVVNAVDDGWGIGGHALTNADIDEV